MKVDSDSILVATDEKADSYKFYDNSEKLDERLKVIAKSDLQEYQGLNLVSDQTIAPGMLFGKHPYIQDTYIDLNTYEDRIFKYVQLKMREIAFLLGVKQIEFSVSVLESKRSERNIHIEGKAKGIKAYNDIKNEEESKLKNKYSKSFTFEGGNVEYDKAKKLAEESGLMKVEDIEELLMYHNPEHANKELSREVKIEISKEFNSRLDVAATVSYLNIFSVKADYEEKFKVYNEYIYNAKLQW